MDTKEKLACFAAMELGYMYITCDKYGNKAFYQEMLYDDAISHQTGYWQDDGKMRFDVTDDMFPTLNAWDCVEIEKLLFGDKT